MSQVSRCASDSNHDQKTFLVDVSEIFYYFCLGEGKGKSGATGRGGAGRSLLKITGGRGGLEGEGGGGRRVREGVSGGLNFFVGAEIHQTFLGRARVKFAQNEGHEQATEKAQTLFFKAARKGHDKATET